MSGGAAGGSQEDETAPTEPSPASEDEDRASPANPAIDRLLAADEAAGLDAKGLADLIALLAQEKRDGEASVYAERLLVLRPAHRRALRVLTRSPRPGVDVAGGWRDYARSAPEDPEPWLQIARLANRANQPTASVEACDEVLARAPGHAEALAIKLADLPLAGGHGQLAKTWSALHAVDPKKARSLLARAREAADADAAVALLGAAGAAGDPDGSLAKLRTRMRITLAAAAYGAEAAGDQRTAAIAFSRLTQLDPGEADYADGLRRTAPEHEDGPPPQRDFDGRAGLG